MEKEFKDKTSTTCPPKTWKQLDEIGSSTEKLKSEGIYGARFFRQPPYTMFMFRALHASKAAILDGCGA